MSSFDTIFLEFGAECDVSECVERRAQHGRIIELFGDREGLGGMCDCGLRIETFDLDYFVFCQQGDSPARRKSGLLICSA